MTKQDVIWTAIVVGGPTLVLAVVALVHAFYADWRRKYRR
jgi:hypothetical protein